MSTLAVVTRRNHHPRTHAHHMHVFRVTVHCWIWDCPCGGGIHNSNKALPDQHSALVAALVHHNQQAGA